MADRTNYIENILRLSQVDFKYLNYDAIFSDETENYRYPSVPVSGENFTITLRVARIILIVHIYAMVVVT